MSGAVPERQPTGSRFAPERPRGTTVGTSPAPPRRTRRSDERLTSLGARGEPFVWLTGAGLGGALLMIAALLLLIVVKGSSTFWPKPIIELTLVDDKKVLGEVVRTERFTTPTGMERRRLVRVGNYDLYGDDFRWIPDSVVRNERYPPDAWWIERHEWGPAVGFVDSIVREGVEPTRDVVAVVATLPHWLAQERASVADAQRIERYEIGHLNHELEKSRLQVRAAALRHGEASPEHQSAAALAQRQEEVIGAEFKRLQGTIQALRDQQGKTRLVLRDVSGQLVPERPSAAETPLMLAQVVRATPVNRLGLLEKLEVYLSRWREFLSDEPREANTEGGVFPAIFGTLTMTVLMSLVVAPLGVLTALYLREYAKQGPFVSAVRIAVNNLAGVPSIVFGVFGLGFFCYAVGGKIDTLFYPERLPTPTFGTGGILWASLTLALMTVPVVIVATEEALAAVPRSLREGSLACGASKWQTIWRIVIPRALPGMMTGMILAMARGAGEVAPLMITGVVKLAPELPFDGTFPFVHLERSFMHLGFHIFDVGFQSRNSEAAKPMVFTTTLLLITLVAVLNVAAIQWRARLRRRFKSASF